jgi:diacylglycerol kinase (ATP)
LRVVTPQRRLFAVEGVSAGFHAAARHRYDAPNSADLAAGVRALAAELRAFRPRTVGLRLDGAPFVSAPAAQVFLSNLPYFGFGFRVDPVADPRDGLLEAIVLDARTRRDVIRVLRAARSGRHLGRAGTTWRRAAHADLEEPLPLVADAQPLGVTTATVTVVADRLRIVAPGAPA